MVLVLLLNVGLFLCVAAAGAFAAWLGWELSGDDRSSGHGDRGGGSPAPCPGPLTPAGRDDLARSA